VIAAVLFLLLRAALLYARQPFFDELFTVWISSKSFAGILQALQKDSGPPLYYFAVHALGLKTVFAARLLSLACAAVSMAGIARRDKTAALLMAVFPPAILFAVDARAYAMCAMFVTIGVLALGRERYGGAAVAFVLAAYSHYYGFLFFPLLIRRWRALAVALIAFAPGLWLAMHQPAEATRWIGRMPGWPDALFVRPPIVIAILGIAALLFAGKRWNTFTTMTVVPIAFALVLVIAGRPVYLPMRFESVIAPPLVLAVATSLPSWRPLAARALLATICGASFVIWTLGLLDHMNRPPDDYREAARVARLVPKDMPLVATGYLYLETVVNTRPGVIAFPAEQGEHPGWRARPDPGSPLPPPPFFWVGERAAPELQILRRAHTVEPFYSNARAVVARVR